MKACSECGTEKMIAAFYTHPAGKDGHMGRCKECVKAGVRRRRVEQGAAGRERDRLRARKPAHIAAAKAAKRRRRQDDPEKERVYQRVYAALRRGDLVRQPCVICGDPIVHAHHEDYSKPLEVVWLCPLHHAQHHHCLPVAAPLTGLDNVIKMRRK